MKTSLSPVFKSVVAVGLLLALLLPAQAAAQSRNLYDWAWVSRLGPTALPGQGPIVPPAIGGQPESLAADAAGNVIIAGLYNSDIIFDNPNAPYQVDSGAAGPLRNGFLAKYTPGGALAWSLDLSCNSDMGLYDVAVDGIGNVYALGSYAQQLRINGNIVALATTSNPCFLAKFSPAGTLL